MGDTALSSSLGCESGGEEVCGGVGWGRRGGTEVEVARAAVTFHGVSVSEGWEGIKNHIIKSHSQALVPETWENKTNSLQTCTRRNNHNTCAYIPVGSGIAVKRISGSQVVGTSGAGTSGAGMWVSNEMSASSREEEEVL